MGRYWRDGNHRGLAEWSKTGKEFRVVACREYYRPGPSDVEEAWFDSPAPVEKFFLARGIRIPETLLRDLNEDRAGGRIITFDYGVLTGPELSPEVLEEAVDKATHKEPVVPLISPDPVVEAPASAKVVPDENQEVVTAAIKAELFDYLCDVVGYHAPPQAEGLRSLAQEAAKRVLHQDGKPLPVSFYLRVLSDLRTSLDNYAIRRAYYMEQ
ncbi:MAG TPA: hypothetical protein VEI97_18875, partial [bacterium]|nr:hypothetical protein [bacterium]